MQKLIQQFYQIGCAAIYANIMKKELFPFKSMGEGM